MQLLFKGHLDISFKDWYCVRSHALTYNLERMTVYPETGTTLVS